jgi:hypothetical protein
MFLSAAILAGALLAGCGPEPDQVVVQFFQKIQASDFNGARKLCTEGLASKVTNAESMTNLISRNPFEGGQNPFVTEKLTTELQEDIAKVKSSDVPFLVIVLVKQKSYWKIDRFDVDLSSLGDMMRNMPDDVRNRMPSGFPGGR